MPKSLSAAISMAVLPRPLQHPGRAQTPVLAGADFKRGKNMADPKKNLKPFQKGNPGGPGRPKGSRTKIGEVFLDALLEDFTTHGKAALAKMREDSPSGYLSLVAGLLPKEATLNVNGVVTHRSEPVSELDSFLEEVGAVGLPREDKEPVPN